MKAKIEELRTNIKRYQESLAQQAERLKGHAVPALLGVRGVSIDPDYDQHALFLIISEEYANTHRQIEMWKEAVTNITKWCGKFKKGTFYVLKDAVLLFDRYNQYDAVFMYASSKNKWEVGRSAHIKYEKLGTLRKITPEDIPLLINQEMSKDFQKFVAGK